MDAKIVHPDGHKENVSYLAIELGMYDLFDFVAQTGRFEEPLARFYFRQLIDGVYHAHKKGMAHGDIKPENIVLDKKFNLKIVDFGYAKPVDEIISTGWGGTDAYMPPEQLAGRPYTGANSDVSLFIMVVKARPFKRANTAVYRLVSDSINAPNNEIQFWERFTPSDQPEFYSLQFKKLITKMF